MERNNRDSVKSVLWNQHGEKFIDNSGCDNVFSVLGYEGWQCDRETLKNRVVEYLDSWNTNGWKSRRPNFGYNLALDCWRMVCEWFEEILPNLN